jgi:hypothetical protein
VFICYRRESSGDIAGRIADRLRAHFGDKDVFRDIEGIPPGVNYVDYIAGAVEGCSVFLVLVARDFLDERLARSSDLMRIEIEEALARGKAIIPILVRGAVMPEPEVLPPSIAALARINAVTIASGREFDENVSHLIGAIEQRRRRPPPAPRQRVVEEAPADRPAPGVRWPLLPFVVVIAALAIGGPRMFQDRQQTQVRREAARAAEAASMRAVDALIAAVGEVKLEAHNAAANPRLQAALLRNVDAATLSDLLRSEEWWAPYRNAFKVYAVALEGEKLDVVEGLRGQELASDLLVREARVRREVVAEIVMGKGWPYAAAAAAIDVPEQPKPVVLILARPLDEAVVRRVSEKARGAVLISDGQHPLLETGLEAERNLLRLAVGNEWRSPIYQPADPAASWAAGVSALAPSIWMWTFARDDQAARDAGRSLSVARAIVWPLGLALVGLGLWLAFRRVRASGLRSAR